MEQEHEQAIEHRERRIDEALKESFPASDTPSFVGAGASMPTDDKAKAAEMAGVAIDQHADLSVPSEEQERRKRKLLKGPGEFRDLRRDLLVQKR
jgi:hypothetical protein